MSFIINAVTAYPENQVHQHDVQLFLKSVWPDKSDFIEQFMESTSVKSRNLTLPLDHYQDLGDSGKRNRIWKDEALRLQNKNIKKILHDSEIDIKDIGLLVSASTTGIAVPSLEALLLNQFSFASTTKRLPIFGLGCLAGVAGINRVNDYLNGNPTQAAILMVTELCSLTYQFSDQRTANIIGTALFGDGAGAVLMVGNSHPLSKKASFEIIATESVFYPNTERLMGWDMVESGFQIVLSSEIPNLVREHVGKDIVSFLKKKSLTLHDISFYVAHPGGPKVLEALQDAIEISKDKLALSWESLYQHGNTSASSVINVLEQTILTADIAPGSLGLMMAMGPGFSLELGVVKKC
jgi:alkylresorcinol/alkylpyrone synthase